MRSIFFIPLRIKYKLPCFRPPLQVIELKQMKISNKKKSAYLHTTEISGIYIRKPYLICCAHMNTLFMMKITTCFVVVCCFFFFNLNIFLLLDEILCILTGLTSQINYKEKENKQYFLNKFTCCDFSYLL